LEQGEKEADEKPTEFKTSSEYFGDNDRQDYQGRSFLAPGLGVEQQYSKFQEEFKNYIPKKPLSEIKGHDKAIMSA
jgi:hypothetical protein